jgi:hypothetical protein
VKIVATYSIEEVGKELCCQRTVLDYDTPILPVGEVNARQICPENVL